VELFVQSAIRAAWIATRDSERKSGVRAAREDIARWQTTPNKIDAMARALVDFVNRPYPEGAGDEYRERPIEWLYVGSGCTERTGTESDARHAAWAALSAAVSILVEVPVEHVEDEAALLSTLAYTNWRVPRRQEQRVARRFARFVSDRIETRTFTPPNVGAT
jgi:hypothetical protein